MKKLLLAISALLIMASVSYAGGFQGMYTKDGLLSTDVTGVANEVTVTDNVKSIVIDLPDEVVITNSVTANALILNSPRWEDLRMPGNTGKPGAAIPDFETGIASLGNSVGVYCFDKNTDEELYFVSQFPHSANANIPTYRPGTDVELHLHWFPVDSGAGTVQWVTEVDWTNISATLPASSTFINSPDAADGTAFKHQIHGIATLDGTDKTISSIFTIHLFRDANGTHGTDDYDNDACLLEIDIHYQTDTPGGSEFETAK